MNLTEQEAQFVLQAVMKQSIQEYLPIFLKMTQQKLVPIDLAQPTPIRAVDASPG